MVEIGYEIGWYFGVKMIGYFGEENDLGEDNSEIRFIRLFFDGKNNHTLKVEKV